nr:reverse transcriptase [Tanacetum cinerariifolium]
MDENMIRLLLKEQHDAAERLAQLQAAAFQAQIEALRGELQVATGRLKIVGFNLEGAAAEWFRWMSRNGLITDWPRVTDISEALLISFYISGMKLSLQRELLVSKPTNLGHAFALESVTEVRMKDQNTVSVTPKVERGHKCPGKFLLLMTVYDDDPGEEVTANEDEAVESGDISILNSLVGHGNPRSLQLWGTIALRMTKISLHRMQALLDMGDVYGIYKCHSYALQAEIEANASGDGIGAVLMHGSRPVSYFSRKLMPRMRVAATYQKELFAIVKAVYKWQQYLLGRRFTIRMDHKSINELMQQLIQTPLQQNRPLAGFIGDLQGENETLAELLELHQKMDNGECRAWMSQEDVGGVVGFVFLEGDAQVGGGVHQAVRGVSANQVFYGHSWWVSTASSNTLRGLGRCFDRLHYGVIGFMRNNCYFGGGRSFNKVFHFSGTQLSHSTAYHAQTDGQMEVVNRCLKQYLRAMVSNRLQQWVRHLPWAEYCYNSSYYTSIKMSPFSSLVWKVTIDGNSVSSQVFKGRGCGRFAGRTKVAYRLALPVTSTMHPVFHVSILKAFVDNGAEVVTEFPEEFQDGQPVEKPLAMRGNRVVLRNRSPVKQILVQWAGGSPEEATWAWLPKFQTAYPAYNLEDKFILETEGMIRHWKITA